jgi:DNA polymerase III subunit delta'
MKPSQQSRLYGLNKYLLSIVKLYDNKMMPNKILFSGKKGSGKSTLAYHIINYILSKNEEDKYDLKKLTIDKNNRSFNLIKNSSHSNFYLIDLIDDKKNIEINQIRQMINYTNKSSFNLLPKLILIDNIENLNKNSTNALLKIIEEPNDNTFFILINNNSKNILPTLKSRCINYKIDLNFDETIAITNLILNKNLYELINDELIHYYNTPGFFINLLDFAKDKKIDLKEYSLTKFLLFLIDNGLYKKNKFIKELIISYIELFFLKKFKISKTKNKFLDIYYDFIRKINDTNRFNLDDETLFMEFRSKLLNE